MVEWCDSYTYLGSIFTCDGSVSSAVSNYAKTAHALTFVSFLQKNRDVPFYVKRRVFDAAVMSTMLYGCESWLEGNIKPIEKLYNWYIKQLLGVRLSTYSDFSYVELGLPPIKYLVKAKQRNFFQSLWRDRQHMRDDPWAHIVKDSL